MPQPGRSKSFYYLIVGLAVVGIGAFMATNPSTPATVKPTSSTSKKSDTAPSLYQPEDYTAHFPRLTSASPDVFKPLVAVNSISGTQTSNFDLPTEMTGGEPNWAFTGTASINGDQMALFENSASGKADYVKIGQHWKSATLKGIDGDSVVLASDGGSTKSFMILADQQALAAQFRLNSTPPSQGRVPPLNPTSPLTGAIGGGIGFEQTPGADGGSAAAGAAPTVSGAAGPPMRVQGGSPQGGQIQVGNRRNRRGRRGGGGQSVEATQPPTVIITRSGK